jgi:hypothetical protein
MSYFEGFTFYGDLLGTAAAYRLSPTVAYEKLDARFIAQSSRGLKECVSRPILDCTCRCLAIRCSYGESKMSKKY